MYASTEYALARRLLSARTSKNNEVNSERKGKKQMAYVLRTDTDRGN